MRRRGRIMVWVQVAGLFATGYIIWHASVAPRLRYFSAAYVVADAFEYALLAWLWSAALVLVLSAVIARSDGASALRTALRTSRTAVWFAPACILLSQLSPAAAIPALALVMGATQLLYSEWATRSPAPSLAPVVSEPFQLLPAPCALRALAPVLATSLGLQAGFVAIVAGYPLAAAFLFCATAAVLTLLLLTAGLMKPSQSTTLPRSIFGVVLTVILAAGLTTVHGLARMHRGGSYGDPSAAASRGPLESLRELLNRMKEGGGGDDDRPDASTRFYNAPDNVDLSDKVFPGVILWPEMKHYVTLVAPTPAWTRDSIASVADHPYSIPFDGEYWMFKPPQLRPPRGAYFQRGTPLALFYRTTDHRKMAMEAHQRLQHPVALDCCQAIQIAIYNADRYAGTISLELGLVDNRAPPHRSLSLGTQPVTRWPRVERGQERVTPVSDLLEFRMPSAGTMREFNEFRVVMHRDLVRADKSAHLAIDRFVLVPRSL